MTTEDETLSPDDEAMIQTFESATDAAMEGDFSELEAMLPEPEPNFFMPALGQLYQFRVRGNETRH
jgi:hypothetical protein